MARVKVSSLRSGRRRLYAGCSREDDLVPARSLGAYVCCELEAIEESSFLCGQGERYLPVFSGAERHGAEVSCSRIDAIGGHGICVVGPEKL